MDLFYKTFEENIKKIDEKNVEINFIGEREKIPERIKLVLEKIEKKNKENKNKNRMKVFLALFYGGRLEIVEAIKKIPTKEIENLTEEKFEKFL
jgi:undecaprenyl diphosphate synthase